LIHHGEKEIMRLENTKVANRLTAGFGIVTVLMATITILGIFYMAQIKSQLDDIVNDRVHKLQLMNTMTESVHIVQRVMRTIMILDDDAEIGRQALKITDARTKYDDAFAELEKMHNTEQGMADLRQMHEIQDRARALNSQMVALGKAHKAMEAKAALISTNIPANQQWLDALHNLMTRQTKDVEEGMTNAQHAYDKARVITLLLSLLSLISAIVAGVMITRSLTRQLGGEPAYAADVANRIADGDLSFDMQLDPKDRNSMLYAMKKMQQNLARIVAEVRTGTDAISSASSEIATGNLDLSSRTEEQASSLEQTAASMEELTSTVRQNSENAHQANQLANSASDIAVKGGEVVSQVVTTMNSINESSMKIVDIISVIDSIAFQTNILALNAAVEAARAGEQGRGFAVVASEVRSLAQRSATAAKEIKALIDDSVEKVGNGSTLVNQAGTTMEEVVNSVKRVADIIGEITAASQEQTQGIDQINQAVTQMDEVTQQNAALVEEAAAASEAMKEQANKLSTLVSVFKLNGMLHTSAHASPASSHKAVAAHKPSTVLKKPSASLGATKRSAALPAVPKATPPLPAAPIPATTTNGDDWEEF
jgi:methyl-accepting chemotaxis protein